MAGLTAKGGGTEMTDYTDYTETDSRGLAALGILASLAEESERGTDRFYKAILLEATHIVHDSVHDSVAKGEARLGRTLTLLESINIANIAESRIRRVLMGYGEVLNRLGSELLEMVEAVMTDYRQSRADR
jgi:hypothetical protein